jgi:hypothetical protein
MQASDGQFPVRTILYYPTIDVPNGSWLRHALLYWDHVSSIVPKDYEGNLINDLSAEVQYLISEGQFNPIRPEELMSHWDNLQKFETEFLSIVNNPLYGAFIHQNVYGASKKNSEERHWSRIHRNKTSDSLFYVLKSKGLAKEHDDHEWYKFETNTALLYMSILAKHLANVQDTSTVISTDYSVYEALNFRQVSQGQGSPIVNFNLNRLLPVPVDNVPFEKILDFKRERRDDLVRFRRIIFEYQNRISNAESDKHILEIVADLKEELVFGVKDLTKAMRSAKINSRLRNLRSVLNLSKYPGLAIAGDYIEKKFELPPQSVSMSTIALTAAVELSLNFIEHGLETNNNLDSAFSYVYEANKSGIIKL